MKFLIFLIFAFFIPISIGTPNNLVIAFLPLLLWGKYIFNRTPYRKWYLLILSIFLIRLISQFLLSKYQSPYILGDFERIVTYLCSIFIFLELFKDNNVLRKFTFYTLKISWILVALIFLSYLLKIDLITIDSQNRWAWYGFSLGGGPNFSVVFTFLGILQLYDLKSKFPNALFKKKIISLIKILPYVILCILGGTRVDLLVLFISIILYLKPPKFFIIITSSIILFLYQSLILLLSQAPSFDRIMHNQNGGRFIIWQNFLEKLFNNSQALLWGYGPGYIMTDILDFTNGIRINGGYFYQTHNMFLQVWLGYGLIFLIIFVTLYILFIFKIFNSEHSNIIIYGFFAFVFLNEIFNGTYFFIGCNWVFAASYALLFNSIRGNNLNNVKLILNKK